MSDVSSQKFLQLIKVSFDVSTSVVRDFADCKVIQLPEYGGSVIKFLDLKKHDLYHKWQFNKPCCHCGNTFSQHTKDIDKGRFELLYEIISDRQIVCVKGKGPIKGNGCIQQYCICNIIPRQTISLEKMDISTLSLLLRDCNITPSQLDCIQNLNKQRCRLCHAYSTRSLSINEYDDLLKNIENSTLALAMHVSLYYHRSINEHLIVMKSYEVTTEENKKLNEKVMHELSEMQMENSNLIRNGFKTQVSKIVEAKDDIVHNQNTHFAEIREQIQQLTANVEIIIKQKTITTDNQCTTTDGNREGMNIEQSAAAGQSGYSRTFVDAVRTKIYVEQGAKRKRQPEDATGTEKLATSTQSRSDSIQTCIAELNTEMNVEQGATPKRHHKDETDKVKETASVLTEYCSKGIEEKEKEENAKQSSKQNKTTEYRSQVDVTCQVEGKDLDEWSAVQLLQDTKLDTPLDLSFNIISAEKKCILLELEVPSKVLEDKISFRVALRALIVKTARSGKVDINKQSTITLHLTFKDDLTEDSMREIRAVAYHSNISCMIDGRLKSDQHNYNEDWLKEKCAWLEIENDTLVAENSQLFKETSLQREQISNLKMAEDRYQISGNLKAKEATGLKKDTDSFCTDIVVLHSDKAMDDAHVYRKLLMEHIGVPHLKVDFATSGSLLLSTLFNTYKFCTDIMILHSDKDKIEAHACQKMLKEHIDVPHLKVDLATLGSPLLSTMFNTCKLVFIFHTKNFESGTKESIANLVYGLQSFKDPQRIIPLEVDKVIGTQPVMTLGYVKDIHDLQFPIFKQKVKKLVVQWSRDLQ